MSANNCYPKNDVRLLKLILWYEITKQLSFKKRKIFFTEINEKIFGCLKLFLSLKRNTKSNYR